MLARHTDQNSSWTERTLIASSIPHFFHHDLLLFWLLQKPTKLRPEDGQALVDVWGRLLAALLLGDLEPQTVVIEEPLLTRTIGWGMRELTAYRLKGKGSRVIAVESPAVIIRPLPDANTGDLLALLPDPKEGDRRQLIRRLMTELKKELRLVTGHPRHLADLIESELDKFFDSETAPVTQGLRTTRRPVQLWPTVDDALFDVEVQRVAVNIVHYAGPGLPQWVPRCSCGAALTRQQGSVIKVKVEVSSASLTCMGCQTVNAVPLEQFLVLNDNERVIAWSDRSSALGTHDPLPPVPTCRGNQLAFEWDQTSAGDAMQRFLTLEFSSQCAAVNTREAFFDRCLILGPLENFHGTPVRPEWLDVVEDRSKATRSTGGIVWPAIRIRGIPFPIALRFNEPEIDHRPDTALRAFPRRLGAYWKRYRLATVGAGAADLLVGLSKPIAPEVDTLAGWPTEIFVTSGAQSSGVLLSPGAVPSPTIESTVALRVAIDFGTSSTVVAASVGDADFMFVEPSDLHNQCETIAGNSKEPVKFLPSPGLTGQEEPALFPSALWFDSEKNSAARIRWTAHPPSPTHRPYRGFKWDSGGGGDARRRAYLDEVLFLCMGSILSQSRVVARPAATLAAAFPLAFTHGRRVQYLADLDAVRTAVGSWISDADQTASSVPLIVVNESVAAARAVGAYNPGDAILLADLGGGSLDIALFERGKNPDEFNYHQVGSFRLGGELLTSRIAKQLAGTGGSEPREREEWKLRDSIARGSVGSDFPQSTVFSDAASLFLPLALDAVRVLAEAFVHATGRPLLCLLAGNGWQAARFRPNGPGNRADAERALGELITKFNIKGFSNGDSADVRPKRQVTAGLAAYLKAGKVVNELTFEEPDPSKMPAGYALHIADAARTSRVEWHTLVGLGALPLTNIVADLRVAKIERDSTPTGTPARSADWDTVFSDALRRLNVSSEVPSEARLLEALHNAASGARLVRGPLQITVEDTWARAL